MENPTMTKRFLYETSYLFQFILWLLLELVATPRRYFICFAPAHLVSALENVIYMNAVLLLYKTVARSGDFC